MSLIEYREQLLDRLLTFTWRQWSALGLLGDSAVEEEWVIDPESLLVFSLEIGRYEPRLFDEILAWLQVNGQWLDTPRLRNIIKSREDGAARLTGGVLQYLLDNGGAKRKWHNLINFCAKLNPKNSAKPEEVLFKEKTGRPHPTVSKEKADPSFLKFGFNRPVLKIQKPGNESPVNAKTNLRFLLRSLFGVGGKSEIILYLMTHEGASPREIANAAGFFWQGVHQTLLDMSKSGLVLSRRKGKKVEFWLSYKKWWEFVSSALSDEARPKWLNWSAIFAALSNLWQTLDGVVKDDVSEYMKSSRLQDSLELVSTEFSRAGFDVGNSPPPGLPYDLHQKMSLAFLEKILGASNE
ncbi:MAG: hypothetical protein QME32_06945 [Endomicrobiia bacterium]|nr:hypothetical protein [Endomicrobiia bacterium]